MPHAVVGSGLLLDGHRLGLARARAAARDWLHERGLDGFTAEAATEQAQVVRAWWGDDEVGFVGESHDLAHPVTVVHLTPDVIEAAEKGGT